MNDDDLYLMAESNPLAGKVREQLVAMGLMPQEPKPLSARDVTPAGWASAGEGVEL